MSVRENNLLPQSGNPEETPQGLLVLHIEDSSNDQTLFQIAASQARLPIEWQTAGSAREAIAYFKDLLARSRTQPVRWPDLVILDLLMPLENGITVMKFIHGVSELARVPIVVLSGYEDQTAIMEASRLGAKSVLHKPHDFEELTQLVTSLFGQWSKRQTSPDLPQQQEQSSSARS
jgi:DNA-binding response OmpR family regulator